MPWIRAVMNAKVEYFSELFTNGESIKQNYFEGVVEMKKFFLCVPILIVFLLVTAHATFASTVQVVGVHPGSSAGFADHDSQGWFWGGYIDLKGVADGTPLKCVEKAENKKGKLLVSATFTATAKGNFVSPSGVFNTTSTIGPQIQKVIATCEFNY